MCADIKFNKPESKVTTYITNQLWEHKKIHPMVV